MNLNWSFVLLAGILEVFWVSGLKHATNTFEWGITIGAIAVSFFLLTLASKKLPIGTLYAVFAGIGTAGTVLAEMLVFGEPFNLMKIVLIGTLLCGVIGLKVLNSKEEKAVSEFEAQEVVV
ncbi:multidrug efflux SMR transporter [Planococcus sp. CPCC 101016]|uniref:DMT family transporter n=1 Tax=Planococcus sp. CPCC 101016 TaxID=2599617 RepID=UPI0011B4D2B8|nr:multidrug efflux SMR transporter [Planococcus sp. CPCC 101016]TWT08234.1 multidrug efflux SMR transporter [Planococcus sp. CPCC 101016]